MGSVALSVTPKANGFQATVSSLNGNSHRAVNESAHRRPVHRDRRGPCAGKMVAEQEGHGLGRELIDDRFRH